MCAAWWQGRSASVCENFRSLRVRICTSATWALASAVASAIVGMDGRRQQQQQTFVYYGFGRRQLQVQVTGLLTSVGAASLAMVRKQDSGLVGCTCANKGRVGTQRQAEGLAERGSGRSGALHRARRG